MTSELRLSAADRDISCTVDIDIERGGRVGRVSTEQSGQRTEILAAAPDSPEPWSTGWGCFVMAPWVGRIRHGRFSFEDELVQLDLNHRDGSGTGGGPIYPATSAPEASAHSIHGTVFDRPWTVVSTADDRCELQCRLDGHLGWEFAGIAHQTVEVRPNGVDFTLGVIADEGSRFPAALGWHPWFAKPDAVVMDPTAMYERDDLGIPTGARVPVPPGPWDDCFTNTAPVELHYERMVAPVVIVTSTCDHLVVYDMPDHATCVEPQSGPPDAFNLRPEVVTSANPLRHTMSWSW